MNLFSLYKIEDIRTAFTVSGGTLVDVGGGTGYIAFHLKDKFDTICVTDLSKKMLEHAEKRGLFTCVTDALALPFQNNNIDAVLCTDALHHIKDCDRAVSEMSRILKNNGEIVIVDFHLKRAFGALLYLFEKIWVDDSVFITPNELLSIMNRYGIEGEITYLTASLYMFKGRKRG